MAHKLDKNVDNEVLIIGADGPHNLNLSIVRFDDNSIYMELGNAGERRSYAPTDEELAAIYNFFAARSDETQDESIEI